MLQRLKEILEFKALEDKKKGKKTADVDSIDVASVLSTNNQNVAALLAAERSFGRHCISESKYQSGDERTNRFCQEIGKSGNNQSIKTCFFSTGDDAHHCNSGYSSSMSESDNSSINSAAPNRANLHVSEDELRATALRRSIFEIFKDYKCPTNCVLGHDCKLALTMKAVTEEINSFWGDIKIPLSTKQRRKAVVEKLFSSYRRNEKSEEYFAFSVGKTIGTHLLVCEATYFQIIGHSKTSMWRKSEALVKNVMKNGDVGIVNSATYVDEILKLTKQTKDPSEKKCRSQFESCRTFITWFGVNNGSTSPNEGEEDLCVLPFEKLAQLYEEYRFQCEKDNENPASKSTFGRAYSALRKENVVRFSKGKGTFPTCDICNNANDLLANARRDNLATKVRDLIVKLKVNKSDIQTYADYCYYL